MFASMSAGVTRGAVYGYGPGVKGDLVETTPFHSVGAPPAAILYGATKIIGEQLCRDMKRRFGLDYVHLDISHMDPAFVRGHFPNIYEKLLGLGIAKYNEAKR